MLVFAKRLHYHGPVLMELPVCLPLPGLTPFRWSLMAGFGYCHLMHCVSLGCQWFLSAASGYWVTVHLCLYAAGGKIPFSELETLSFSLIWCPLQQLVRTSAFQFSSKPSPVKLFIVHFPPCDYQANYLWTPKDLFALSANSLCHSAISTLLSDQCPVGHSFSVGYFQSFPIWPHTHRSNLLWSVLLKH